MKNSRILFPLLALAMLASFYYAWQNTPRMQRVASDKTVSEAVEILPADAEQVASPVFPVAGKSRKFSPPKRNLFAQLYPAPPPPPQPEVIAEPVEQPVSVVVTPPPPPPPVTVRTTRFQMPSFQVLGFLEKEKQLTAFLSLQGEIYLVKQGQVFADEYRVRGLDHENITIEQTGGLGEVSLPLNTNPASSGLSAGAVAGPGARPGMRVVRPGVQTAHPLTAPPLN